MADPIAQIRDIDIQLTVLQTQKAGLEQQLAEDPQRQKSCDEVAAAVANSQTWTKLGVTVQPANQGTQIHPDWVYVVLPAKAAWDEVQSLRDKLLAAGGEPGGKLAEIYIHRERALTVIAP